MAMRRETLLIENFVDLAGRNALTFANHFGPDTREQSQSAYIKLTCTSTRTLPVVQLATASAGRQLRRELYRKPLHVRCA